MPSKLYGLSSDKIKQLAASYMQDNTSVEQHWQDFFADMDIDDILEVKNIEITEIPNLKKETRVFADFELENIHALKQDEIDFIDQIIEDFAIDKEHKLASLKQLKRACMFEEFLAKKFIGVKRFSVEGLESTLVLLEKVKQMSLANSVEQINLAMAHRGRLNVLTNYMGKPYHKVIAGFLGADEFNGKIEGDVKYHLGYNAEFVQNNQKLNIKLFNNPSHLEAVNAVALGHSFAKQELSGKNAVLPIIMHGDSAFAGQGSVSETLNLAYINGYNVGGTIHIIQNNKIGFTAKADEATSIYCTNFAKSLDAFIIHVNAEDIEAVLKAGQLAFLYRQKFNKDVFIDLIGFRKYGHNEGDDPEFTNPLMYQDIKKKQSIYKQYKAELIEQGLISHQECKALEETQQDLLNQEYKLAEKQIEEICCSKYILTSEDEKIETDNFQANTTEHLLDKVANAMTLPFTNFSVNKKLEKLLVKRRQSLNESFEDGIDWGMAENLAYASLVNEGISVRFSGQDSKRGTFSHRHLALIDQNNENELILWNKLAKNSAKISVYNSPVSEYAVLGFEYGYNLAKIESGKDNLTIWEAQFGDFANGAQIMFDQFIFSAEQKWNEKNNLTVLLPHGFEGQGPEHSSARIERFLTLAAQNNMRIVNPSSADQVFHLLRNQASAKKPLVMFSPKSLLRRKEANAKVSDFLDGEFKTIKDENTSKRARQVIFCSGKIYHDLMAEKQDLKDLSTAIVAIEQLYPLPIDQLKQIIEKYKTADFKWVQEEPRNAGCFMFMQDAFLTNFNIHLEYIGMQSKASPAVGNLQLHKKQHNFILKKAFK
ncbi:MAG TPA: 2-oxoglutarate dehydrogenase E1 component [Alphaproteobacteria bacterium]|nr:2-oxoglutarate dehydrogenase E1 component [Alphaproteobacteria bacterium]